MADQTFSSDDQIVITVKKKPSKNKGTANKKKLRPVIKGKRTSDILHRRKRGGLINFYDLGQKSNGMGGWQDISFISPYTYALSPFDVTGPDLLQWNNLVSLIFTIDTSDWKTEYRKLTFEDAYKYGTLFFRGDFFSSFELLDNVSNPNWTEKGLDIGDTTNFSIGSFSGVSANFGNDPSHFKVTTGNLYSDPEVIFASLKNGDNVFLMPKIINTAAFSQQGPPNKAQWELSPFSLIPRQLLLNKIDVLSGQPILTRNISASLSIADFDAYVNYIESFVHTHNFNYDSDTNTYTEEPLGFPNFATDFKILTNLNPGGDIAAPAGFDLVDPPIGALLAIIQRSSVLYYVWAKDDQSLPEAGYGFQVISRS